MSDEEKKMEEVTQNLPPHISRPEPNEPAKNPSVPPTHKVLAEHSETLFEATVTDSKSSVGNGQLARRADQLSDFIEQGDLMDIALNPSREKERLTLESYLGYVRQLLQGMVADDSQAVNGAPLPASNGKPDHKIPPKPKGEV
jgi:hypothetical protein